MSKELIAKAIGSVAEEKPVDFNKAMEAAVSGKLSVKLGELVKQKEKEIINKYK
jgi:hypothetical protein